MQNDSPSYPHKRIGTVDALAKTLAIPKDALLLIAGNANQLYRLAKQEKKSDGSLRQTFDAKPPLKTIQNRIKERLLQKVTFPPYLHGSLKGVSPKSNADAHKGARVSISEDIQNFFPSIGKHHVLSIWRDLFGFSAEVASLLTALTTKDGGVPQGAATSSYVANLIFWNYEPNLVRKFSAAGLIYTRYVDDVIVSSDTYIPTETQSWIIAQVYGMLGHYSLAPKRSKHELLTSARRMTATKLVINKHVSLPPEYRQNIRTQVFALERQVEQGECGSAIQRLLASTATKVGRLTSYHPKEGGALKVRLKKVRETLNPKTTRAELHVGHNSVSQDAGRSLPWE